ncbi:SDR family oxidoreductase [candidate division CSSED10-310 bacterium]|uniref:SDR family oxidoreductase n=1 Tax=candidate division CSSED10-310 bacterium TaxID=2855610 RepID=A0ABV6YSY7_UNCC1
MTDKQTVLVIGATGMLGEPVARRLVADGFSVRVLHRDLDRARARLGDGFEYVQGDVEQPDTIKQAIQGCDGVHISVGVNPAATDPERLEHQAPSNVARAAAQAGTRRITLTSGSMLTPDNLWHPVQKAKYAGEMAVKECGVPYSIFACTASMESLAMFIQGKSAMVPGKQNYTWHFFAADDFARMVSRAYQLPAAENKHFYVHGPEALTSVEALQFYCSIFHPNIKVSRMPLFMMKLMGILTFNKEIKFFANLMAYIEKAPEQGDPTEANDILGAPTTTLAQWCELRKS